MLELADDLEEDARLIFLLEAGHAGEGVAVVPHGRVPLGPLALQRVDQNELALFRVAAGLMAPQASSCGYLGPEFGLKGMVIGRSASGHDGSGLLVAENGREVVPSIMSLVYFAKCAFGSR